MLSFVRRFVQRLGRKLTSLAPVAFGAAGLVAVLWGVGYLVEPALPPGWRHALDLLGSGEFEAARDHLVELLEGGSLPPELALIGLQIAQVLVAPIPGQVVGLLSGYLFGFWLGLALTMAGLTLGTFLATGIARLFRGEVIRRFVSDRYVARFDKLVGEDGPWNFFLLFLLPVFPDDAACFLAGLTRIPIWQVVVLAALGRLPGMAVLNFVGARAGEGSALAYMVLGVATVLAVGLWLYSEEVEDWVEALRAR